MTLKKVIQMFGTEARRPAVGHPHAVRTPSPTRRMSERQTPGSGIKGVELIKAIRTLEELEKLSREEETDEAVGEGVEASQGLAANVVSEEVADLIATLKAKVEGPLVSIVGLVLSFDFPDLV